MALVHHLSQNTQHMWLWLTTYHNTCNTCGFGSPPITTHATHVALVHHLSQNTQHMQLWFTTCYKTHNTCGFGSPPITTHATHVALAHHLSQDTQHMWLWLTTYHNKCNICSLQICARGGREIESDQLRYARISIHACSQTRASTHTHTAYICSWPVLAV